MVETKDSGSSGPAKKMDNVSNFKVKARLPDLFISAILFRNARALFAVLILSSEAVWPLEM